MGNKKYRGFSLVELMIVVVIIGVLAGIAYPSYLTYMQQTRRADCEGALMQLASAMERDFSRVGQYRNIITLGNFSATCPLGGGAATYNLSIPAGTLTATTYVLQAAPANAQAGDACGTLTLTNQLIKGQSAGTLAQCWQ